MKKGWKIAAVGFIILLLILIFFKDCLWAWFDEITYTVFGGCRGVV